MGAEGVTAFCVYYEKERFPEPVCLSCLIIFGLALGMHEDLHGLGWSTFGGYAAPQIESVSGKYFILEGARYRTAYILWARLLGVYVLDRSLRCVAMGVSVGLFKAVDNMVCYIAVPFPDGKTDKCC